MSNFLARLRPVDIAGEVGVSATTVSNIEWPGWLAHLRAPRRRRFSLGLSRQALSCRRHGWMAGGAQNYRTGSCAGTPITTRTMARTASRIWPKDSW